VQINPYGKPSQGLEPLASRECGEIAASLVVAILGIALDYGSFSITIIRRDFNFSSIS